jgi:hypothetical protein
MVTANNNVVNPEFCEPPTEALHDRSECQRCQTPRLARLDRSKPDNSTDGVAELVRHAGQPNPPMDVNLVAGFFVSDLLCVFVCVWNGQAFPYPIGILR